MQKSMWKNALFFDRFLLDFDLQNEGQILPKSFQILLKSRLGTTMAPKTPPRPFRGAFWSNFGAFLMNFGWFLAVFFVALGSKVSTYQVKQRSGESNCSAPPIIFQECDLAKYVSR